MKIYKYTNAVPHVHDSSEWYKDVIPFSDKGLSEMDLTDSPEDADFFYMGQWSHDNQLFNINNFEHFNKYPEKHIVDLEGDGGFGIPEYLWKSIITVNGPLAHYDDKIPNLFVRPTFSRLFVDICKNRFESIDECYDRSVGFKGLINCKTRYDMFTHLHNRGDVLDTDMQANPTWNGPSEVGSEIQEDYVASLKKRAFALCPRGAGVDSVRLLEACYYGRIPILISDVDYLLVDHKHSDTSFVRRVIWDGKSDLAPIIKEIVNVDDSVIKKDQEKASKYFEETLRSYMRNPTSYMLDWMKKQGLV
ncbi:hypothetical protein [Marinobacter sp.]|jgi:hypothetical protein|uniref:hypothetical protein n=1 Tax=Marinobacter sp. TaxID=50741 RepID=UPI000C96A8D9|nr:hypothetical protein [Marinobacter sp.]MAK50947.1 hypothetical protein [Marinobacter sp.]